MATRREPKSAWVEHVQREIAQAGGRLSSASNFDKRLTAAVVHAASPLRAVHVEFKRGDRVIAEIGSRLEVKPSQSGDEPLGSSSATCRLEFWAREQSGQTPLDFSRVRDLLADWVRAIWNADCRDPTTDLLGLQSGDTSSLLGSTVSDWVGDHPFVACFFADLDNFKLVNDTLGQAKGDEVIQQFALLFEMIVPRHGLSLRRSQGADEFLAFVPCASPAEALAIAAQIMAAVADHDFGTGEIGVGVAVGIGIATRFDEAVDPLRLAEDAEHGLKPDGQGKRRGLARFGGELASLSPSRLDGEGRDMATIRIKSTLHPDAELPNPWLQTLSEAACNLVDGDSSVLPDIQEQVEAFIGWAQPESRADTTRLGTVSLDLSSELSPFDIGAAVAHGIFKSMLRNPDWDRHNEDLIIRFSNQTGSVELLLGSQILLQLGETLSDEAEVVVLGGGVIRGDRAQELTPRLPVVLKIGYEPALPIPDNLLHSVIFLDTRPTVSGGLPDFWAGAVAELLSEAHKDPNIPAVFLVGDSTLAVETHRKLQEIDAGNFGEELVEKTGLRTGVVRHAVETLAGRILTVASLPEVWAETANLLRPQHVFVAPPDPEGTAEPNLKRVLSSEALALKPHDGCRVKTVAEAFPVVLEIARTASGPTIEDQVGRKIRELIDFKVVLTEPLRERIPAFYGRDQGSFEEYFERHFLNEGGLFGASFAKDNQLGLVTSHVASVIEDRRRFATRRAILVVPHDTMNKETPTPLGLVSVRIIPRFIDDEAQLSFSFTWRTVEALVGFPYSIYGSVCFGEHLTSLVREQLPETERMSVGLGSVSYVAHSLHTFVDDYGQKIARQIVNHATV